MGVPFPKSETEPVWAGFLCERDPPREDEEECIASISESTSSNSRSPCLSLWDVSSCSLDEGLCGTLLVEDDVEDDGSEAEEEEVP